MLSEAALRLRRRGTRVLHCGICRREGLKSELLTMVGGSTRLALARSRHLPLLLSPAPAPLGVGVPGTSSRDAGEAVNCVSRLVAQCDQPGGNPCAATRPHAMPQHGSHPSAALVRMPGSTLPSRPGGGGSRPPWDVAPPIGLTTRRMTTKEALRTGGEDATLTGGPGSAGGSPDEDTAPCVSDFLLPAKWEDTHDPCGGMPWSAISGGIPRKSIFSSFQETRVGLRGTIGTWSSRVGEGTWTRAGGSGGREEGTWAAKGGAGMDAEMDVGAGGH